MQDPVLGTRDGAVKKTENKNRSLCHGAYAVIGEDRQQIHKDIKTHRMPNGDRCYRGQKMGGGVLLLYPATTSIIKSFETVIHSHSEVSRNTHHVLCHAHWD